MVRVAGEHRNFGLVMSAVIGMRILLVEDEPAVQETRADVLRDHGYTVDLAGTLKPRTALGRRPVI